jgi:hypothetical protein
MVINVAMDGYGQANSSVSLFGWLVAGDWCWFVVREKYCWLACGWWLVLIWCERKALLTGYQVVWTDQQDQEFGVSTSFALLTLHELNHEVCCITR